MSSRSRLLDFIRALGLQLCVAGLVGAQTPPPETPPAAVPTPPEAAAAEAAGAEALPSEAGTARRSATEEIVVTGSRIRRKDLSTPAPITIINREQIANSGRVSIGDFLQALPSQGNAVNTTINNGGDGTTQINLRGLGSQETLVLLNGRRIVAGLNSAGPAVDLNSIPTAAIERVEVLKDGASAVYGSDAIGGVVNLITRKRFNGGEFSGYIGTSTHADATIYDFNGTSGVSGDRGSALFSLGYYTQHPAYAGDRNFSEHQKFFDASGFNSPNGALGQYVGGSGTIPNGRTVAPSSQNGLATGNAFYNGLTNKYRTSNSFIFDPTIAPGTVGNCDPTNPSYCWRAYNKTVDGLPTNDLYNFAPVNYLVTPQQRISMFSTGELKIANVARAYYEASFVNRQSKQQLAPEPLVVGGEGVTISQNNVYNPFGRDFTDFRRRLLEFGPRTFFQDLDTFRSVFGFDGTLPEAAGPLKGWFWDVSMNYGRTFGTEQKHGNLYIPNLQAALGPSFRDANGVAHCGTAAAQIAGCVPLDLFHGPGTITPDQVAGLTFTGNRKEINQMVEAQANFSGELFKILHERPVGLAVGYDYRILAGSDVYDPITVFGLTTGNKATNTAGHYYLNEGYGELSIPIVSGMPFAESLEATAAVRVFDYSNFGTDATYKIGGLWRIIPDFTFRGTYSTGFRAPSIGELYLGQADNFPNVTDPCRNRNAPASCGAAANNGDTATQLRSRVGGNPNLQPEKAKIYTAGAVIEPSMIKGLSATVDYYNITIDQTITTLGANVILSGCYPTNEQVAAGVVPKYCDKITRDPITQFVTNITDTNTNAGQDTTAGIDMSLRYVLPTEYGRFGGAAEATWLHHYNRILPDGTFVKGRGTYDIQQIGAGSGGVFPAWKAVGGINYGIGGLSAGVIVHFVGSYHECGDSGGNFAGAGLCYQDPTYKRRVGDFNSEDLYASYTWFTQFGRTTFSAGVNNILNHNPPYVYNGFTNNSDPSAYADGYLGRFFYGRLQHSF